MTITVAQRSAAMDIWLWFEPNLRAMLPKEGPFKDFESFGQVGRSFPVVGEHKVVLTVDSNQWFVATLYNKHHDIVEYYDAPLSDYKSLLPWLNEIRWMLTGTVIPPDA